MTLTKRGGRPFDRAQGRLERAQRVEGRQRLAHAAELCATLLGIGRLPFAPGTLGSLAAALLLFPLAAWPSLLAAVLVILAAVAVWSAGAVAARMKVRDPSRVVIDEALGMGLILAMCPPGGVASLLVGFVLFRAFDVIKPPPLRALERLPGGLGIVADDVGAAFYTIALLWLLHLVG